MRQEVDLIKFAKGINQDGFVDRIKKLEDGALKTLYRLNKIESDEDIVRKEFFVRNSYLVNLEIPIVEFLKLKTI